MQGSTNGQSSKDFLAKTLLVGIGAQKAGTTWIWKQLCGADDVFMYRAKEMHYFDAKFLPEHGSRFEDLIVDALKLKARELPYQYSSHDLADLEAQLRRLQMTDDVGTYLDYFRANAQPEHAVFGEVTPSYSMLTYDAFSLMRDCHPKVKLVYTLRDPVDRFVSARRMRAGNRRQALDDEFVLAGLNETDVVARSAYDRTMSTLDRVFEPDRVFIGFFEDMFQQGFLDRLAAFAGVKRLGPDSGERVNPAASAWTPSPHVIETLRRALAPVYDFCRDRFGGKLPGSWRV